MRLHDVDYSEGRMDFRSRHATEPASALRSYLDEARAVLERASTEDAARPELTADFEHLRWFPLPDEAAAELRGEAVRCDLPMALHVAADQGG